MILAAFADRITAMRGATLLSGSGKEATMGIRDWPASERPQNKLLARGVQSLSDAELLAVLIQGGGGRNPALEQGLELLQQYRSLRALLQAGHDAGTTLSPQGQRRHGVLQAALELSRRHYSEAMKAGPALEAPQVARQFLVAQLRDRPYEVFCCLHLDNRHRLIAFDELFRGTIDGASVHPREVVKQALARNAAAVILAHNHPSGVAEPSHADELITARLRDALALVDIRVLDHLVVGDTRCESFAERGLL